MTLRPNGIALLSVVLLAATSAPAFTEADAPAIETATPEAGVLDAAPYVVCIDDICRVTDEPRPDEPSAADVESTAEPASTSGGVAAGPLVCLEGKGECTVADPAIPIEDMVASARGRLVYGAVDADPSGAWRATNLPARVRCTITGAGKSSIKLKRTRARASIERQADGSLVGQSTRKGEKPFRLVPMGPGLYGSIQPFSDGKVSGVVVSYYGMLSEDRIAGTSLMTSTLRDGGARTDCAMKRNFDMKRISGPNTAEATIMPSDPDEAGEVDMAE